MLREKNHNLNFFSIGVTSAKGVWILVQRATKDIVQVDEEMVARRNSCIFRGL
jgi:hypothetical protein